IFTPSPANLRSSRSGFLAIARDDLLFTMSDNPQSSARRATRLRNLFLCGRAERSQSLAIKPPGGARRDRTDDLLLAKQALSQLSYGPAWLCTNSKSQKIGWPGKI